MTRREMLKLTAAGVTLAFSLVMAPHAANAGPGEAAGGPRSARAVGTGPGRADFVVLIWYRRDDPLGTFQYQTYDARKGEYSAAVDDWIKGTRVKYPMYLVRVLPVDLGREQGATEKLKVGSVVHRELLLAAAQSGVVLGAPLQISPGPSAVQSRTPSVNRMPAPLQPDRSFLNAMPTPSIPVYPRTRPP